MHSTRTSLYALIVMILTMHCGAFDYVPSWQTTVGVLQEKRVVVSDWLRGLPTTISKTSTQKFLAAKTCVKDNPVVSSGAGLLFLAGVTAYWNRAAIAQTQTWQQTSAYVSATTQEIKKRLVLCWGGLTGAVGKRIETAQQAHEQALKDMREKHQREVSNLNARIEHLDTTIDYQDSDISALQAQLDARVAVPQPVPHVIPQQTQPASQEGNLQITTTTSSSSSDSSDGRRGVSSAIVGVAQGAWNFVYDVVLGED